MCQTRDLNDQNNLRVDIRNLTSVLSNFCSAPIYIHRKMKPQPLPPHVLHAFVHTPSTARRQHCWTMEKDRSCYPQRSTSTKMEVPVA